MLAYIKGTIEDKAKDYVVIETTGLGYKVFMPETAMEKLGNIGDKVKVYTYYRVREDDISIFGFNTKEELRMFELLLSVSGIGAKTAIIMISIIEPSEFALAVIANDISKLVEVPGIGTKSAQRIVLELKDKLKKEEIIEKIEGKKTKDSKENVQAIEEAMSALQVLGYNKKEIEKVFEKIEKDNLTVEELIKHGLKELSKK